jgi:hypothetical protein
VRKKILYKPNEKIKNTNDNRNESTASSNIKLGGSLVLKSEYFTKCFSPEIIPTTTSLTSHIPRKVKISEIIKMKSIVGISTTLRERRRFI